MLVEMNGQPLGEVVYRGFSGTISHYIGEGLQRGHGGDVQNDTFLFLRKDFSKHLGWKQCAHEIQAHNPVQFPFE